MSDKESQLDMMKHQNKRRAMTQQQKTHNPRIIYRDIITATVGITT